ncbi:RICIN domain-containing protein [Amycolatopsis decaplanina]|uniref:RICIN domain-containing protein n=1 Tax=Amycolatopsis decaplanina TaxID=208441 RepID=UPI000348FA3E|nr:RICIN domain-containing protein [Amycolatopsis decaplanina]
MKRLIVATAIVATTAGVVTPATAVAAPPSAPAAAAQSTDIDKGNAAAVLKIVAGPDLLVLSDRGFVAAMYYAADDIDKQHPLEPEHQKLKETAIAALAADGEAASTQWIKVGIHDAHREDEKIVTDRRQQQEQERAAKALAASTLSIPVDNTVLAKSIFDFIVHLELNADGYKDMAVKEAARTALRGTADDQWRFLTVVVFAEHKKDVDRVIQDDATKDEAAKAAERAKAAKANAVSHTLGSVPTARLEYLINLKDRDFVVEIWKAVPRDTEVHGAAEDAVGSLDPADWTFFINQGAEEAHLRDIVNELNKRDQEYIRQITELRTRAANQLIRPALVAAADAALAAKRSDREKFLRTGQYENLVQTLRVDAYSGVDVYLTDRNGDVVLEQWQPGNRPEAQWRIEPGLSNPECFSFQSVSRPNHYLRWRSGASSAANAAFIPPQSKRVTAYVDPTDGSNAFKGDATWCVRGDASSVSIRPSRSSGKYLFVTGAIDDDYYAVAPEWHAEAPQAPHPVDRRYAAEQPLRDKLGKPIGDFVPEGTSNGVGLGHRVYEKGRLYLTAGDDGTNQRIAVQAVYNGPVLDKLLALGGPAGVGGAMTDQVPAKDGNGQVLRIVKPTMGGENLHIVWSASTGAHIVFGLIGEIWANSGGETGPYGYPLTDEGTVSGTNVRYSRFATGTVYYVPGSAIRQVKGEIHRKFAAMGFEAGMGYPVADAGTYGQDNSPMQRFTAGSVYITRNGTVAINGDIHRKFAEYGYETGSLGYPTSDIRSASDGVGKVADFAVGSGSIYWHPSTGARLVYGNISLKYKAMGAERSYLGYPKSDETGLPMGKRSVFQNGRIDWSSENGGTIAYRVAAVPHNTVDLRGAKSGRCIQTAGLIGEGALNDLAGMELWDCVGGVKQLWDVTHLGNNVYTLKNRHSGKCLDLRYGELHNGNAIVQYQCHNGTTQQWEFTTTADGSVALRSVHSAKIVEAAGAQDPNATAVVQQVDSGQAHQRWTVYPY